MPKRIKKGEVPKNDLIAKSALAKKLGISPVAIQNRVNRGTLHIYKEIPGIELIYVENLHDWIQEQIKIKNNG